VDSCLARLEQRVLNAPCRAPKERGSATNQTSALAGHTGTITRSFASSRASAQDDFVFIEPDVDECKSAVGRIGGRQRLCCAVGDGFNTGSVIHEIGHAFGYQHEHQRPDRDQFVTVNTDNIEEGKESNFSIRPGIVLGPYDYGSIMHYPRDGFADGGDTIVPPDGVSIGQRERVASTGHTDRQRSDRRISDWAPAPVSDSESRELVLDQESFGDNGTQTAGPQGPNQRGNQVNEQNDQIPHRAILPMTPTITKT